MECIGIVFIYGYNIVAICLCEKCQLLGLWSVSLEKLKNGPLCEKTIIWVSGATTALAISQMKFQYITWVINRVDTALETSQVGDA